MDYKISYPHKWNKNGCHYNQLITIKVSEREAIRANVLTGRLLEKKYDEKQDLFFYNLCERNVIAAHFGIDADKRFLDRNTCVRFIPS